MNRMLWLFFVAVSAGPLETLRPYGRGGQESDLEKLRKMVEEDKRKAAGLPPVEEAPAAAPPVQETPAAAPLAPAPVPPPRRAAIKPNIVSRIASLVIPQPLTKGVRLPITLGAIAATVYMQQKSKNGGAALEASIQAECEELQKMTASRSAIEPPSGDRSEALAELRARKACLKSVLPALGQLSDGTTKPEDLQALTGSQRPGGLAKMSSAKLTELNATLAERITASGTLLAEYESLGQPPPPGFRMWSMSTLEERYDNITSKRAELIEIVRLLSQLGNQRMDWNLPAKTTEELSVYTEKLNKEVAEFLERKERQTLLGKIEAEMWRRKEETPIATGTLDTPQLKALLKKLKSSAASHAEAEEALQNKQSK